MIYFRSWIFTLSVFLIPHRVVALDELGGHPVRREVGSSGSRWLLSRALNIRATTADRSVNIGAIVGGTIGGVAFVALLILAYFFYRRRKIADVEEGTDSPDFRPSWMVRIKSLRFSTLTGTTYVSQDSPSEGKSSLERKSSWFQRFSYIWASHPSSPSEDNLFDDKLSAGSNNENLHEKTPPLPHKRVVQLQRQISPTNPIARNRPIPPVPLHSVFPDNGRVRGPRDLLTSYESSHRSNRRRIQIPPQAIINGISNKRRSRALIGSRSMSGSPGRNRRTLLPSLRPMPQQQVPSSATPTEADDIDAQPSRQASRRETLNRLLGREGWF